MLINFIFQKMEYIFMPVTQYQLVKLTGYNYTTKMFFFKPQQ